MIERLPTTGGLVRSGVAPDHFKIKTVNKVFEKIARSSNFRLFANVELGKDVTLKDLLLHYNTVAQATSASKVRKLGISGEQLENSFSAAEFAPWDNSNLEFANLQIDLSCDTAVKTTYNFTEKKSQIKIRDSLYGLGKCNVFLREGLARTISQIWVNTHVEILRCFTLTISSAYSTLV